MNLFNSYKLDIVLLNYFFLPFVQGYECEFKKQILRGNLCKQWPLQ